MSSKKGNLVAAILAGSEVACSFGEDKAKEKYLSFKRKIRGLRDLPAAILAGSLTACLHPEDDLTLAYRNLRNEGYSELVAAILVGSPGYSKLISPTDVKERYDSLEKKIK